MHYKEERSGQKWLKDKNEVVKFLYRGGALCCRDALKMLLCGVGIWLPMSQIQAKTLAIKKKMIDLSSIILVKPLCSWSDLAWLQAYLPLPNRCQTSSPPHDKKNQEIQETASNILPRFRCKRSLRRNRSIDKVRCTLYFVGRTRKLLAQTGTSKSGFPQVSLKSNRYSSKSACNTFTKHRNQKACEKQDCRNWVNSALKVAAAQFAVVFDVKSLIPDFEKLYNWCCLVGSGIL